MESLSVICGIIDSLGYECMRKYNLSDALSSLESSPSDQHPEVIISDLKNQGSGFFDSFKEITVKFPDIISIILTDSDSHDTVTKIYEAGASDYFLSPVTSPELKARIENLIQIKHSQEMIENLTEELNGKDAKLAEISMTDEMTKIYNRRFILDKLKKRIDELNRSDTEGHLSIIIFDIDCFREVNDSFGHLAGDKILHIVAQLAKNELNSGDLIGRFGGEEFIIVLNDSKPREAYLTAEKIRLRIRNASFSCVSGNKQVTISCGVASYQKAITCNNLLKICDDKMYEAKQKGKDNTQM